MGKDEAPMDPAENHRADAEDRLRRNESRREKAEQGRFDAERDRVATFQRTALS